jgi:hypothetical protein
MTSAIQTALLPKVKDIEWIATDEKSAVVSIEGENFFTNTSILLGSAVHDSPSTGLVIKSDQSLQLRTTISDLVSGEAMLNGRYGPSVLLQTERNPTFPSGIGINTVNVDPYPGTKTSNLKIDLYDRRGIDINLTDFLGVSRPLVMIGGTPIMTSYDFQSHLCDLSRLPSGAKDRKCVLLQVPVSKELFQKEVEVVVRYPFRGPEWKDSSLYYNPQQVTQIFRIGGENETTFAIQGSGFNDHWKVQVDKVYTPGDSKAPLILTRDTLLTFAVDSKILKTFANAIVIPQYGEPSVLAIPPEKSADKPATPQPKVNPKQGPGGTGLSAIENSSTFVTIEGSNLDAIKTITFENEELPSKQDKTGCKAEDGVCKLAVFLSRHVTAKAGKVAILLKTGDGTILPVEVVIVGSGIPPKPTSH